MLFVFVPVILWNLLYVQERKRCAERERVSLFIIDHLSPLDSQETIPPSNKD